LKKLSPRVPTKKKERRKSMKEARNAKKRNQRKKRKGKKGKNTQQPIMFHQLKRLTRFPWALHSI